jgi:hypothetical protein
MSNCKLRLDGKRPDFRPSNRTNVYYENDYTRFGDNIITQYFVQCPFDTWGVPARKNTQETGELTNGETED